MDPRRAQPTSKNVTPPDDRAARAGGEPQTTVPFEYATAFEPDETD